jgi:hypothetical protein
MILTGLDQPDEASGTFGEHAGILALRGDEEACPLEVDVGAKPVPLLARRELFCARVRATQTKRAARQFDPAP